MKSDGSVTAWVAALKLGDEQAATRLWDAYSRRVVGLAWARLKNAPRRAADEEDVTVSTFKSLFLGAKNGRFARLLDRDDLWQLLVVITIRKCCNLSNRERRQVRGGGRVRPLSELAEWGADDLAAAEPSPALAAQITDEFRHLLDLLRDESLRSVALLKLEGYTNTEIAAKLGCVRFTIDRKLRAIRQLWKGSEPDD
jgi:DNA-directed RNA polymerase specialized sigma24 family protein